MNLLAFFACFLLAPVLISWLLLSCLLAIAGTFLKKEFRELESDQVKETVTVCKVLCEKSLLSPEEYNFETNQVAKMYCESTFTGYLFILAPVIHILRHSNWLDSIMLSLVHRWMRVHHDKISKINLSTVFEHSLVKICTLIARNSGYALQFFSFGFRV